MVERGPTNRCSGRLATSQWSTPPTKARVFISCGQNRNSDEIAVAKAIADSLSGLGYDPYIAVQEQTLRGLTQNIFRQLADSEYLIFIDSRREQLANSTDYRGSLFSHQELAIAAFLDLDVLAFQEAGVLRLDGIMRFLQTNAIEFAARTSLPQLVSAKVRERGWAPSWRKTLRLERDPAQFTDAVSVDSQGRPAGIRWFFHASVVNQHKSLVAAHAYVYLDRLAKADGSAPLQMRTIELKWAGYIYPNAVVRPGTSRDFDCCWIHEQYPSVARFNVFADSTDYMPVIQGPGDFQLSFMALADGFSPQSLDLTLTLGNTLDDARLVPA